MLRNQPKKNREKPPRGGTDRARKSRLGGLLAGLRATSNRQRRENRQVFSRILVPVAFVAILVYLVFAAIEGIRDPYTFVLAYEGTIEDGMRATGWVVREESPIPGGNGTVQLKLTEGEKIGKGQPIGVVYQNADYEENQRELTQAQLALTALQYATYNASPTGPTLEEQLLASMKSMRMAGSTGSCNDVTGKADNFRKLILRREFLVSGEAVADMTQAAGNLTARINELQSSQAGSTVILASSSGIFCTNMDGYETLLTPDGLSGVMPEDVKAYSRLTPEADISNLGKLITSWRWYYAVIVTDEEAKDFSAGTNVEIQFDSLPKSLPMTVQSVSENQNHQAVVVFRSAENLGDIQDLRQESCEIVFQSDSGIIVPKGALHVLEDGQTVVYAVSGYLASMKPVTVVAENEKSYLIEPKGSDGKEILRPGEEVILASAEIYDGKVVR